LSALRWLPPREMTAEVSCSCPQASQDQKLLTQRSLMYLEIRAAISTAQQLGHW